MKAPVNVPKEDLYQKMYRDRKREVQRDLTKIQESIKHANIDEMHELHQQLDGKYSGYIQDWGKGMYGYNTEFGFDYDFLGAENDVIENLRLMSAKLEGFMLFQNDFKNPISNASVINNISNTVNTQINMNVAITEAQEQISELTALSLDQIDEINKKLEELKKIVNSQEKKPTKWEKAKPIFKYIIDKGLDVAKIVVPLILNI